MEEAKGISEVKNDDGCVTPMSNDHLVVITELAKIGLDYLKTAIPAIKGKSDDDPLKPSKDVIGHLESLTGVAGEDAVAHFYHICQFIYDQDASAKAVTSEGNAHGTNV